MGNGSEPVAHDVDGMLVIDWPEPLAASYPVAPEIMQEMVDELNRLRRWKAEAVEVLKGWDLVADAVERREPARLGSSRSSHALRYVLTHD